MRDKSLLAFVVAFLNLQALSFQQPIIDVEKPILGSNDFDLLRSLPRSRSAPNLAGFKKVFVNKDGVVSYFRTTGAKIEILGSPGTTFNALLVAASYIRNITKYMPASIFNRLASESSVGIFSRKERLTVFPEYAHLKNGQCGSSCSGACALTCTGDGRKIEDLAGIGGRRAVILDDNILCSKTDHYHGRENILAHEFTHTIHQYALSGTDQAAIEWAFRLAKRRHTWNTNSYAMSTIFEYFAEGATVFFGVNSFNRLNTGGMNLCGSDFCRTEKQARFHLRIKDGSLYNILSYVFTDSRPFLMNKLSLCPSK